MVSKVSRTSAVNKAASKARAISISKPRQSALQKDGNAVAVNAKEQNYIYFPAYFTEEDRLDMLLTMQLANFAGVGLAAWSIYWAYSEYTLLTSGHSILKYRLSYTALVGVMIIFSVFLFLIHAAAYVMLHLSKINRWRITMIRNTYYDYAIWTIVAVIGTGFFAALILRATQNNMESDYTSDFKEIIANYKATPANNDQYHSIDLTQINLECCGARDFSDWFDNDLWKNHVKYKCRDRIDNAPPSNYPFIPFSCCNFASDVRCYQYVPRLVFSESSKSKLIREAFYYGGCTEAFMAHYAKKLYNVILGWTSSAGILLATLLSLQYLKTSIHFSILWSRRPDNTGLAWAHGPAVNCLDLGFLVQEGDIYSWKVPVKLKKYLNEEQKANPLGVVKPEEIQRASQMRISRGVVSTVDGKVAYAQADVHKDCNGKDLSAKVVRRVARLSTVPM